MKHQPGCLSLDNVLGRHACDCKSAAVPALMRAQVAAEFELAHSTKPRTNVDSALYDWHPMPPPREGNYLVTVAIDDDGVESRSVRLCYYDGARWIRAGGYVRYVAWGEVPSPAPLGQHEQVV